MKLALIAILLLSQTMAFWSTGHMIIAMIAENELKDKYPAIYTKVMSDLNEIKQYSLESTHNFVESATWADDNKSIGWGIFNNWHFVDTPVIENGWKGDTPIDLQNATYILGNLARTLSDTRAHKFNDKLSRSFSLRYFIHVVGDIHQPLHATTYFSNKFEDGDRGGNSWKVNYPANKEITNLHALWDACVDQYGSIWTPISNSDWTTLRTVVKKLTDDLPRDKFSQRLSMYKYDDWAKESHQIAIDHVYKGITPDSTPSADYIKQGRTAINDQLVVGGYRLTDRLVYLYQNIKLEDIEVVPESY